MRVHYIQHVPFEGLGSMETWLKQHGHSMTCTKIWEAPAFPAAGDYDALIIMGGPMGVYDDHLYQWLPDEKNFIFDAIHAEKTIIGICLGAQLLACVLGATVYTNKHKEIGWFPINILPSLSAWLGTDLPKEMTVFHWHGDKFDIPYGGENHAFSQGCNHQLFTFGDKMIGLQFHLEATPGTVASMLQNDDSTVFMGEYVQDQQTILQDTAHFKSGVELIESVLSRLLG
ncbi:MAG: type 1 glutamine amidotransferase [Chitinophagaceae bacterium]|nr:type 1 glutamine amidotransferase [Chitinophagaceae bacterium]